MTAAERSETEFRERLDRTVNLMERLNLPAHIQDRVRMWFDYNKNMQKNFGTFFFQVIELSRYRALL